MDRAERVILDGEDVQPYGLLDAGVVMIEYVQGQYVAQTIPNVGMNVPNLGEPNAAH